MILNFGICRHFAARGICAAMRSNTRNNIGSVVRGTIHDDINFYRFGVGLVQIREKGHSKWQNIKNTKEANDRKRSLLFIKIIRQIRLAVQRGGKDPSLNTPLANAIEKAKVALMPKGTIENAIKGPKDITENGEEAVLEVLGPGRCFIIIECLTNNVRRTKHDINYLLKRHASEFTDRAHRQFTIKGVVRGRPGQSLGIVKAEAALEHAIEVGAEDVKNESEGEDMEYKFLCDVKDFGNVREALKSLGYEIGESGLEFVPNEYVQISDVEMEVLQSLYDKLDDLPDVQKIYVNVE